MSDQLKEERLKILELLQEGKITPDQAEALLTALTLSPRPEAPTAPTAPTLKKQQFRMLRITVDSHQGDKVRVNVPIEFAKLLKKGKFGNVNLDEFEIDIDSILDMINQGAEGEIVSVDSVDGDKVRITVE